MQCDFKIIFTIFAVNNIFYICTPSQILIVKYVETAKDRKFVIANYIETKSVIEKVLDITIIDGSIVFSMVDKSNKLAVYNVKQNEKYSFDYHEYKSQNY